MVLTPSFDKDVTEYSATTTSATNTITATAEDEGATVEILNGETPVESGSTATWVVGDNEVTITVTNGEDEKVYSVTVHKPSSEKAITSFVIGEAGGVVDESNHTIAVEVESGTDVTTLTPTIAISANATVSPESGVETDFTSPVTYTVTAEDETTQAYVVTVTVAG